MARKNKIAEKNAAMGEIDRNWYVRYAPTAVSAFEI
jgi:hypothetical protein